MMRRLISLALFGLVAGCISPAAIAPQELAASGNSYAVIALIDTGINPWHEAFAATDPGMHPPADAAVLGADFRNLVEQEGIEAWKRLEPGVLYWFEGTRVLGISILEEFPPGYEPLEPLFPPNPYPIYDDHGHGSATASIAAKSSAHAWIVMVKPLLRDLQSYAWMAEQPWIDVISSSINTIAHTPDNITGDHDAYAAAFQRAVTSGKLVVNSGGNTPDPNLLSQSGPPWVISVGGADPDRRGWTPITSRPIDVLADFEVDGLADNESNNGTWTGAGTSFGAPRVAGVLAEAVYQMRVKAGHTGGIRDGAFVDANGVRLTNEDFRRALNLSALYWNTTDYQPVTDLNLSGDVWDHARRALSTGAPHLPHVEGTPVGPWVEAGWGYVHDGTSQDIVALLSGQREPPDKRDAAAYMEALFAARQAVWDARQGSE